MTDPAAARDVAAAWQPQLPGDRAAREIPDAIVEPAWGGVRVAIAFEGEDVDAFAHGEALAMPGDVVAALRDAFRAMNAVIEGHLTPEAFRSDEGAFPAQPAVQRPSLFIPRALRGGGRDDLPSRDRERTVLAGEAAALEALARGERLAFVATDLLWLDGESLLDVPLLERKRWLEHVLEASAVVRVSAFVRASSVMTLIGWGTVGFAELSYRGANSRYLPGRENPDWTIARTPKSPA